MKPLPPLATTGCSLLRPPSAVPTFGQHQLLPASTTITWLFYSIPFRFLHPPRKPASWQAAPIEYHHPLTTCGDAFVCPGVVSEIDRHEKTTGATLGIFEMWMLGSVALPSGEKKSVRFSAGHWRTNDNLFCVSAG